MSCRSVLVFGARLALGCALAFGPVVGCEGGGAVAGGDGDAVGSPDAGETPVPDGAGPGEGPGWRPPSKDCSPSDCDDDDACTTEKCDLSDKCVHAKVVCDDEDSCTIDSCDPNAGCVASASTCDDGDPCTADTCDGAAGCVHPPLACDDGDACDGVEVCEGAAGCVPGTPLACDDGLPCNGLEACDPASGCLFVGPPPAGCCAGDEDCDDENLCNGTGSCDLATKTCDVTAPPVCGDGDPCNGLESCDPGAGCVLVPSAGCSDGNVCNGVESCTPGAGCVSGTALTCDDGDECTVDACDPETGCHDGGPVDCGDGDACTAEACDPDAGCVSAGAVSCQDGSSCTIDLCDPISGCVFAPIPDCGEECPGGPGCPCVSKADCDDLDPCDGVEACDLSKGCQPGKPLECDDDDPCTTNACLAGFGCTAVPLCASLPGVAEAACDGGECEVLACAAGAKDANGEPDDGCEAVETPGGKLHVDAAKGNDDEGDGSPAKPFATVERALLSAFPGYGIALSAGAHEGPIEVPAELPGIVLAGAGIGATVVTAAPGETAIDIEADGVAIRDLTVSGGSCGIEIEGEEGALLAGGEVSGVRVEGVAGDPSAAGIHVAYATGVVVQAVVVQGVSGAAGASGSCDGGGAAQGVDASDAPGLEVLESSLLDIAGGAGGSCGGTGGTGGKATAIRIDGSPGAKLLDTDVKHVSGGAGGASSVGAGGDGGDARGVKLSGSPASEVRGLGDFDLEGGAGGAGVSAGGEGGAALGLHLEEVAGTIVDGLRMCCLAPGAGGSGGKAGERGKARGVRLTAAGLATFAHAAIYQVGQAEPAETPGSSCVYVESGDEDVVVDHLTCALLWDAPDDGTVGVHAGSGYEGALLVRNSIVAPAHAAAFYASGSGTFTADRCLVWQAAEVSAGEPVALVDVIEADPLFAGGFATSDLHLLPASPAIDAGHPASPYCEEPAPNGGAADLGAYGNTPEATPAPGAVHVPCP